MFGKYAYVKPRKNRQNEQKKFRRNEKKKKSNEREQIPWVLFVNSQIFGQLMFGNAILWDKENGESVCGVGGRWKGK